MGFLIRRHKFNLLEGSGCFCFPFRIAFGPLLDLFRMLLLYFKLKSLYTGFAFLRGLLLGSQISQNHMYSIGMSVSFDLIYYMPKSETRGTCDGSLNERRSNFQFLQSIAYKKRKALKPS